MPHRNWEDEYERMLAQALEAGRVTILPKGSEKRRHPRFRLHSTTIYIKEENPHEIIDISRSGMAFFATRAYQAGQQITISLQQLLSIEAEVLGCELVETDTTLMEYRYKVRTRFNNEEYGLQFLVMSMEMDEGAVHVEPVSR